MIYALILILGILSFNRTEEWQTEMSLWSSAVNRGYEMARSHLYLGLAHKDQGDLVAVDSSFARAATDRSMAARAINNRGSIAYLREDYSEARRRYLEALEIWPDYPDALSGLATVRYQEARQRRDLSMMDEVIAGYRYVLTIDPHHQATIDNLNLALEAVGHK